MSAEFAAVLCTLIVVSGALVGLVIWRKPIERAGDVTLFDPQDYKNLKDRVQLLGLKAGMK